MTDDVKTTRARELEGRVISTKMDKTVTVEVSRFVQHPRYHKFITRTKTYKAHDAENACQENDVVVIREGRPVSKNKRWVVIERRA